MDSGVLWIFAYDKPIICWRIAAADGALNCYVAPAPSDMTTDIDLLNSSHLYAVIAEVLDEHIRIGQLPPGLVLLEKPIAEVFQTSRAPVRRALAELESRQLIHRFDGRGASDPHAVQGAQAVAGRPGRCGFANPGLVGAHLRRGRARRRLLPGLR